MAERLRAPFPYYGGKSRVAAEVWRRFGDVRHYIEPFCGSCAVLLARPDAHEWWNRVETVNDIDGLLCNFWRAVQHDPDAVAAYADWPVNECDLHARHRWLVGQRERITDRLMDDPDFYDAKVAGWWVWGISAWIGSGWCPPDGRNVGRRLPHMGHGRGVLRASLGDAVDGIEPWAVTARVRAALTALMRQLSDRLRRVRVACGDWQRVVRSESVLRAFGAPVGVFLDPPYAHGERDPDVYVFDADIWAEARAWALAHGDDPRFRIALCGYGGEHDMPPSWSVYRWSGGGGFPKAAAEANPNRFRETIWFSPHCLNDET
jgi:DNA adenine methylase